ncbi:M28 family peptidase [Actinoalloteichus caeruleus]|uniref:Aminopeptidase Y n=1 Tax=Actinoalloteichus caeruleus DSM 43889 TaxID=1120930 RepID=A0ABT1JJV8_ACTCY|nr:M28 family peptidase [Actinoalloteichus caeruleus]MCP2332793.1 aminopeptidase Y [Actinoalloteichus caeruleus DSM 43889]
MTTSSSRRRITTTGVGLAAAASLAVVGLPAVADTEPVTGGATGAPRAALPERVASAIELTGLNRHLVAFQRISDRHGGTRAAGEPGYDASVDYVVARLEEAGFDVTTPEFEYERFTIDAERLLVSGAELDVQMFTYSPSTPAGGLDGPLVPLPPEGELGCDAADFVGVDVTGAIAVARRGECAFAEKGRLAADAGAAALLVVNNTEGPVHGTLGDADAGVIPVAGLDPADGDALFDAAGTPATLELLGEATVDTSRNVLAQTSTGRTDNVVVVGAHLDAVYAGISDNGTGSAALLETALRLGAAPEVNNAIRFAWWGAEELGLHGSTQYVRSLDAEQQLDIALYLNLDMIGSPNPGYFVYDGDGSDGSSEPGPHGSAQIERALVDHLAAQGIEAEGTAFDGRSDYREFVAVGIPAGGLFTGAEGEMTEEQAAKWGGTAGDAYDPHYHQPEDDLDNVDRRALLVNARTAAHVATAYGLSTREVNGEPGSRRQAAEPGQLADGAPMLPRTGRLASR